MNVDSKLQLVRLLDEYCNEYYSYEHECTYCYFGRYNNCPVSKTANRLQEEYFEETRANHEPPAGVEK